MQGAEGSIRPLEAASDGAARAVVSIRRIGKIDSVMVRDPRALEVRVGKALDTPRRPLQRLFLSAGQTDKW